MHSVLCFTYFGTHGPGTNDLATSFEASRTLSTHGLTGSIVIPHHHALWYLTVEHLKVVDNAFRLWGNGAFRLMVGDTLNEHKYVK